MKIHFSFRCLEATLAILITLQFIIADEIPGTSLQTGVWYTIKLKHRSAILNWAEATVKSKHSNIYYNYAQVVFGDVAKRDFEKGKKYYADTQWMLVKSDTDGAYFIQNKNKKKAVLTYVDGVGDTDDFNWAVLFIDYNFKTNNDYLWKFVKNSDDTYRMYNLAFPKNGALTLLESQDTGHKEKKYCRILLGDPGAINYEDDPKFSWSFESDTPKPPKMTPSPDMVPVKPIPGTGLCTGTYYTITMKSNEGKLTWSYTKVKSKASSIEYNYAQIVFGETGRCEYNSKGAKYFADTKWMLVPTEDEDGYVFRNMAEPGAVLTWVDDGNTNGYVWTVLYLGHAPEKDSDYAEGGKYRKDGSFRITKNKDESYRIFNRRIEEQNKNGVMTFNRKPVTQDKRYCQFVTTTIPDDQYIDDRDYHWIFRNARTQVRIKNIPGTSLFTGIAYIIALKGNAAPLGGKNARMIYSNNTFEDGGEKYNYLYAAYGEYKKEFIASGANSEYGEWVILESTKKGKYQLVNVAKKQSVIGWAGGSPSGSYVVAHEDHAEHPDYQPDGKYYDDILWQFERQDVDQTIPYYNIFNSRFYPKGGIMTWTTLTSAGTDRRFLQIYKMDSAKYKSDGDYLWHFVASNDQPNDKPK